jgi:short-subunit dehydrogenase
VVGDVSKRQDMERVAAEAIKRFGRIDTWVNNAGLGMYGRLEETPEQDARRLFDINYWGVVNGSLAALPHLRTNGGALINVGSEVSDAAVPILGHYAASKHAVKGFTDSLRIEVERIDKAPVSITLIQPTAVNTPFPQRARNYTDREPKLPTPQIDPEKVARAILHAAVHGGRDVTVGMMAKLNTTTSQLVPALADRFSAKQVERQHYDQPPVHPEGTLHQAGPAGRIHRGRPVLH